MFFQSKLFEGLEEDSGLSPGTFVPRKNIKKLVIKSKSVTEVLFKDCNFLPFSRIVFDIYICYLQGGRSVLGKTVPEVLSTAEVAGQGPYSRPRAQFFPIRTDLGRQITCLFFSSVEYFVSSFCVEFSLQPFSNLGCAQLANQIQGFRIPECSDAWENIDGSYKISQLLHAMWLVVLVVHGVLSSLIQFPRDTVL